MIYSYILALLQEEDDLQDMMTRVFQEGLEGLVLKDVKVRRYIYFKIQLQGYRLSFFLAGASWAPKTK